LGAALVALLLLSGELGDQASTITKSRAGETPLMLNGLGVQLSITSDSRAGETPIVPGSAPRAFVAEILTPLVGLEVRRPNVTFQTFYSLRLFWQDPSPITTVTTQALAPDVVSRIQAQTLGTTSSTGPLILHSVGLTLDSHPSRVVTFDLSATGSVGSPDYTALPQVLGPVQGTLPPVVSLASGEAQANALFHVAQRWDLTLEGQVFHWQWLDVPDGLAASAQASGQTLITGQTMVSVEPGATYALTARDGLNLGTAVGEAFFYDGLKVLTVTPEVTWRRRLTARDNLKLSLGVAYAHTLATAPDSRDPLAPSGSAASPIGSIDLNSHLLRSENITVLSDLDGAVDFYVDPVLGTALPRGRVGASVTVIAVPHWMITLRGNFGTVLEAPPIQATVGQSTVIPPDETVFSISLSGRRRISENFFAEIGGLWADRGPYLDTTDFRFHQRQLWINVAFTGTTRPISRQTLPTQQP